MYLLCIFKFLSALDGISLIFGSPLSYLTVCLRQCTLQLSFGFLLFFKLLSEKVTVMAR